MGFETREKFRLLRYPRGAVDRIGFGHLSLSPAQLVWPSNAKWCWVQHPIQPKTCYVGLTPREAQAVLWRNLKEALIDPALGPESGQPYFDANVRGTLLPRLTGTLISSDPLEHPSVLLAAISDRKTPEVRLVLNRPLKKPAASGSQVEFEGVAAALSLDPFLFTFDVETARLTIRPQPQ